jgi:arylsulfatase I/J
MATPAHTPAGRGYDSSLNYHHHENDYWNQTVKSMNCTAGGAQPVDFWDTVGPAFGQNNSLACSQANQAAGCEYEDAKFTRRVLEIVAQHDPAQPLFLFWAPHSVHVPLEVPTAYLDRFAFIDDPQRRSYAAMVNFIDEAIGNVTAALQARGMWESTLLWAFADNGGPIMGNGVDGANNWPLRGGKYSNFQGGVRANCFVSGGAVPAGVRGTPVPGLVSIADVYTTLCALAGVDPADDRAAAAGLPPVDGLDMWPLLSGANATGPRADVPLGTSASPDPDVQSGTVVQGVVRADGWKLLINEVTSAVWTSPQYPNGSTWVDTPHPCGDPLSNATAKKGCLFNVLTDPSEYDDVAEAHPDIVLELRARITQWQATAFAPERGADDGAACRAAMSTWRGSWGPFLP